MAARMIERVQIVAGFGPVDMQTAANNGDWVSMKLFHRLLILLHKAVGTAGDDPIITLKQATDVAGTGAKALNFTEIFVKLGTLANIAQFTRVTQAAANTYVDAVSAEAAAIFAIEVQSSDLDVANGFDCVQLSVPDVGGNAQLGSALYLLYEPRYASGGVAPGAIAD